jgi:CRISPR-associated endonuclease Csy4
MTYYIEIKILPDPEFSLALLMNALYNKLHRALTKLNADDIGISFPRYDQKAMRLGDLIRLHGSSDRLEALVTSGWLTGMNDHVKVGTINQTPLHTKQVAYRRIQTKSSTERLIKRRMKRHNLNLEEATELYLNSKPKPLHFPYINLKSQSTGQIFKLFILQEEQENSSGLFNTYGLSKGGTVPLF